MKAREMFRESILSLNSKKFGILSTYLAAGLSWYAEAKDVSNMVIPDKETERAKNKRINDFGVTNNLVYSYLMESCF